MYQKHLRYFEVSSQRLRGNPLGNSPRRLLAALLPESLQPETRYPTVWVLPGYPGNGLSSLNDPGALGTAFCENLLQYQRDGILPPCIFVFPDCSTRLGGSQYLDSAANGPFLSHLVDELVPFVDAQLPTRAEPRFRTIAGHSSGGYGALIAPLLRPGVFGSALVSAADSLFEMSQRPLFPTVAFTLKKAGGMEPFLTKFFAQNQPENANKNDFSTIMILCMATCYSPRVGDAPLHAVLPFDLETLELNGAVWDEWMEKDPVRLVQTRGEALRQLQHLHLDCGAEDEYAAQFGHRVISRHLKEQNIPHLCTEFPGGHRSTNHRYRERLSLLGGHLRGLV